MTSKIKRAFKTEPKRYLVYARKGEVIIKEGILLATGNTFPNKYNFYPYDYYDKSYKYAYTQLSDKPLTLDYNKVWCETEEDLDKAITMIKHNFWIKGEQPESIEESTNDALGDSSKPKNSILKECPFCGSKCEITKKFLEKGNNTTGFVPEGAVIYRIMKGKNKTRYFWHREKYMVRCYNRECIASTILKSYKTLKDAMDAWNRRGEHNDKV